MTALVEQKDRAPPQAFSQEDVELIKNTVCKGATDSELKLFLHQCKVTGLNPLARQIYSIERNEKRDDKWVKARSIQTSIDGFRLIAERTGKYSGQLGPFWCDESGEWKDVWLLDKYPVAARVGILRSDFTEPCWGVARFKSYAQTNKEGKPTKMWATMPDVMIAKCAESLALRKAFPQELSGLYTSDEMQQADVVVEQEPAKTVAPAIAPPKVDPPVHPETGELSPHTIPVPALQDGSGTDWLAWAQTIKAAVVTSKSLEELEKWVSLNAAATGELSTASAKMHGIVISVITQMRSKLELQPKTEQVAV